MTNKCSDKVVFGVVSRIYIIKNHFYLAMLQENHPSDEQENYLISNSGECPLLRKWMLRLEGRQETRTGSTPRVSAKDKSPHPFPAAPAWVLPTVHLKWDVNGLWLLLLPTCWREHQCQGKMIVSLVPSSSHEINITWQLLRDWLVTISFPWVLPAGLIIILNNGSINQHDNSF